MLLFGHLGITLGLPLMFGISIHQLKVLVDPSHLAIGTLLPNLINKTIGNRPVSRIFCKFEAKFLSTIEKLIFR